MISQQIQSNNQVFPVSDMAETLQGSEIIKLAGEVNEKISAGQHIFNLTIGDYDPSLFPIPEVFKQEIIKAYDNNHTNYPAANGIKELREATAEFIRSHQGLSYSPDEFLIAGGARPLIYAAFRTLVDPQEKVIFPVPSWNNNHYTHLVHANQVIVETLPENNFMPTADELRPHIQEATLLALCSPLNPTGTVFTREGLLEIAELVLEENKRRGPDNKPLYLLYDQIYWALTYEGTSHFDPVSLVPEIRPFTIYIDGISKSLAATGVRVGWAFGPRYIIDKMKSILGHVGAWAPKAEQVATAAFLKNGLAYEGYLEKHKEQLKNRLNSFYEGFLSLHQEGFPVRAIAPMAAIYLTVCIDLKGKETVEGIALDSVQSITKYLLEEAGIAIVPFYAFGSANDSPWYRISVGTCDAEEPERVINSLRQALSKLI